MKKTLISLLFVVLFKTVFYSQPIFNWVNTLYSSQGSPDEYVYPIKIQSGATNDVYMVGYFGKTINFDPVLGNYYVLTPTDSMAAFIAKYNSSGNIVWAKQLNAKGLVKIQDFTLDLSDNIYVTGIFKGTVDFDPSATTYTISKDNSPAKYNSFIAKYTSNGSLVWVNRITGSFIKNKIALDNANNIYLGGLKDSIPFFCKYSNAGTQMWRDSLVTTFSTTVDGFYVNGSGNVYISGFLPYYFDMDPSSGTNYLAGNGFDRFIGMYDTNGSLGWCKNFYLGYPVRDMISDSQGNLFVAGSHDLYGCQISKWDVNGTQVWEKFYLGNTSNSKCVDISLNCSNNITVSGFFEHSQNSSTTPNFETSGAIYSIPLRPTSKIDFYVASYSAVDGSLKWANALAGKFVYSSEINNAYINSAGEIYLCGLYKNQSDFDFGPTSHTIITYGSGELFFSKYSGCNVVGIKENSIDNLTNIFPNPSNGVFNVTGLSGHSKIEIYNITGQLLLVENTSQPSYSFDMSIYNKGIYFYRITNNQNRTLNGKITLF